MASCTSKVMAVSTITVETAMNERRFTIDPLSKHDGDSAPRPECWLSFTSVHWCAPLRFFCSLGRN